jgi:hypothetical protein
MSDKAGKAAKIYYENLGKISKGEAIRQAGYAESVSKTPKYVTKQEEWQSVELEFIERLDLEMNAILENLPDKRKKAAYGEFVTSLEKLFRIKQLLSGKPTDNVHLDDYRNLPTEELAARRNRARTNEQGAGKQNP